MHIGTFIGVYMIYKVALSDVEDKYYKYSILQRRHPSLINRFFVKDLITGVSQTIPYHFLNSSQKIIIPLETKQI